MFELREKFPSFHSVRKSWVFSTWWRRVVGPRECFDWRFSSTLFSHFSPRQESFGHFAKRHPPPCQKATSAAHLNKDKIESKSSVLGIQEHQDNALIESFKMSPHLMCLHASIKIPLGPASGSGLDSGWPQRDVGASVQTYQAHFEALIEGVLMAPSDPMYVHSSLI